MNRPNLPVQGFPMGGLQQGRLLWARGVQSIRETLWHILLTSPGERVMRPDFGAGLSRFIHHPNNETTRQLISDAARRAIQRWEARIEIERLSVDRDPSSRNQVLLTLHYRIRSSDVRETMNIGLELQG